MSNAHFDYAGRERALSESRIELPQDPFYVLGSLCLRLAGTVWKREKGYFAQENHKLQKPARIKDVRSKIKAAVLKPSSQFRIFSPLCLIDRIGQIISKKVDVGVRVWDWLAEFVFLLILVIGCFNMAYEGG